MVRVTVDGQDLVWKAIDLQFLGSTTEALRINGTTGLVTISGTAVVGAVAAAGLTLAANQTLTAAAGTGSVTLGAMTGTFTTPTGATTINGAVTLAANKGIAATAGTAAFDLSAAAGTFKTPTGILTFGGRQAAGATVNRITDPGASGAIPVTTDGVCPITTAGAETRTLAIPTYVGQRLTICMDVKVGNCVITAASAVDSAAHATITLSAAGQSISLVGVQVAGVRAWRLAGNDGAGLTT